MSVLGTFERQILEADLGRLNVWLVRLFIALVVLANIDVISTVLAMQYSTFRELNPLAASFLEDGSRGFVIALILKYAPFAPIGYIAFSRDNDRTQTRIVKFAALIALVAADGFYVLVVSNNVPQLIATSL